MKRMLTYALGAVLAASALPAFSQDNFPDTPENHWAYEALARMRAAGLLVGYPDGLFRGARPASRYEMAVALHALYQHLKGLSDGLEAQHNALKARVDELDRRVAAGTGQVTRDDLRQLQEALATTRSAIDGMKAWGDDIAALKRMSSTFERELASMGVDVEALKKGVNDLAARVEALEKRKLPVDIHGDLNLLLLGGMSDSPDFGITVDGRPTGVARDGSGDAVGFTHDLTILHEAAVTLSGTNDTGPKWKATLVLNNMFGAENRFPKGSPSTSPFDSMWELMPGVPFGEGQGTVYFRELSAAFDTVLLGQKLSAKIGRQGHKVGSYFFQRPDNTPYYSDDAWDNGEWIFDGGVFGFDFGGAALTIFGGRQTGRLTTGGNELNHMLAGFAGHKWTPGDTRPRGYGFDNSISPQQHLGLHLDFPLSKQGNVRLVYIILDDNDTWELGGQASLLANRCIVYGGEFHFDIGDEFAINAGYSKTNLYNDSEPTLDDDNSAWWASLAYKSRRWSARVGFRSLDPQFWAPGDWGRIGIWWNPNDLQGIFASVGLDISDKLMLTASGDFMRGADKDLSSQGFGSAGFSKDDKVTSVKAGLRYALNESWDVWLGAEFVNWDLRDAPLPQGNGFVGGNPTERWYTLGLRYRMSGSAWMSFMWQMSDYDSDSVSGWNPFDFSGSEKAKGRLITAQLGIRF